MRRSETKESVEKLLAAFETHPHNIVSLAFGARRGNPAVFPAAFYPELCALCEDVGGGAVIKRHKERLLLVEAGSPRELDDIDTKR